MKTLIETERLLLREITLYDKEELFQLHSDPDVQKYTGEPPAGSMEEIEQAIQTRINDYGKYGYGEMGHISKEWDAIHWLGWSSLST